MTSVQALESTRLRRRLDVSEVLCEMERLHEPFEAGAQFQRIASWCGRAKSSRAVDGVLDQQIRAALRLLAQSQVPVETHFVVVLPALVKREPTAAPSNVLMTPYRSTCCRDHSTTENL
jgi:hypothetical protein